ncbi:lipopolysaccharide biosynthesis protein [Spirosoma sp. KNUC1025]|uniref:lipopolysaccharide biosynthesis protein n=1 Tax=Spirosoma sp. KNUC1025 TaxID=2894082 RepID=UPI00386FEB2E|nr:oligosaccharide flippase family protein [Spirosoma sp. KNUC1025]
MKLLHKNSLSGIAQLGLTATLTFFSIPIFIRMLGAEAYGAFSIVTLAGNLNIFANLGLNTALLKFLSVQGKSKESDYDIAVTLGLLLLIMVPLTILALVFQASILQGMLGLSDELYAQVVTMYRCVVAANLVILLGQTFTTILDSQQRMYLTNFYQLIYSVLYWGGLITVVSLGYGLNEVGMVILGTGIIWFGLVAVAAWRMWGSLQLGGLVAETSRIARKQLAFGSNVYAAGLLTMLFEPMTKVLVSRLIGVTEVGYLEIAYKIRSQLWALVNKVTYPLFPRIARETDRAQLSRIISSYQTGMLLLMIPLLLFISLTMRDIIAIWLPTANPVVAMATLCISATFIINSLSIPPYYFLASRHHVGKTVWVQFTNVSVSLLVGLLTYRTLGVYGFVLGNSAAILSSLFLCLYYQRRYLEQWQLDMSQLRSLLVVVVPIGILAVLASLWLSDVWLRLGVVSTLIALGYLLFLRRSYKTLQALSV